MKSEVVMSVLRNLKLASKKYIYAKGLIYRFFGSLMVAIFDLLPFHLANFPRHLKVLQGD